MEEFKIIGKLDLNKLGEYKNVIATDKVILTNERKQHILERHPGHYELLNKYIGEVLQSPDYILRDLQNDNTIILLKEVIKNEKKIKVVVKLITNKLEKRFNSIITFWNIRKRDYDKTIEKSYIIYKKLDKNE